MSSPMIRLSNGTLMPIMGFGTFRITEIDAIKTSLDAALSCGYRLIDTAQGYSNEAEIGHALAELLPKHGLERKDLFITSKLKPTNMSVEKVRSSVEQSLKDLRTDYADLFLIHYPKPRTNEDTDPKNKQARKEAWTELEKLQYEGKLRAIGVSNYELKHLDEIREYSSIQPAVNQCEFHPHYCRRDLVDEIRRRGIFFQAFTSLGRNDPNLMNDPLLVELSKKYGVSVGSILLAWPLCQGIGALPKSSNVERIRENFDAIKVKLDKEEVEKIWGLHQNKIYTLNTPWLVE